MKDSLSFVQRVAGLWKDFQQGSQEALMELRAMAEKADLLLAEHPGSSSTFNAESALKILLRRDRGALSNKDWEDLMRIAHFADLYDKSMPAVFKELLKRLGIPF